MVSRYFNTCACKYFSYKLKKELKTFVEDPTETVANYKRIGEQSQKYITNVKNFNQVCNGHDAHIDDHTYLVFHNLDEHYNNIEKNKINSCNCPAYINSHKKYMKFLRECQYKFNKIFTSILDGAETLYHTYRKNMLYYPIEYRPSKRSPAKNQKSVTEEKYGIEQGKITVKKTETTTSLHTNTIPKPQYTKRILTHTIQEVKTITSANIDEITGVGTSMYHSFANIQYTTLGLFLNPSVKNIKRMINKKYNDHTNLMNSFE
ncbi:variable surface protein [Plasmodium gonderi]|uniref:Variable surface protein n=1 Tax=Plasmodium gonderi TaxID=77519 RepID=A0A1Y1JUS3_PLAGO|nr:variable surface protein [Plasmodium gonderi]GAW84163.1 variable surface protein [Plasmodium gonderi]